MNQRKLLAASRFMKRMVFELSELTVVQTPFFCGQPCIAGCFGLLRCVTRGLRTSWFMVGMGCHSSACRRLPSSA